ncbi:MAG: hypothetical protein JRF45_07090 [Deltaproteobacteria bacterium]|nr:hypothetical protein [Deltaproteobacteria bacterium]MBW1747815.1 hypothetical protein [Deltaproteobacteria bacterium]MBW1825958.1 hypothetical protein [Deltaproteobacteria bacterium]MBW1969743.1 hypothetical protein [Deltaproteobacteria bacterium]MBW2156979.1 hypothetical protein [Deltaproteobacteria bacterium]
MPCNQHHITDLFKQYAGLQQNLLGRTDTAQQNAANRFFERLLARFHRETDVSILSEALPDPYFPLGMLEQTIFADVVGMRFFINKRRWDLEPSLGRELVELAKVFLRIRHDIQTLFDSNTVTCIPVDETRHRLPSGQWCSLCGVCCQIGGVPPDPPAGVVYPDHWLGFLTGETVENQQLCPFLFQYFGEPRFFCAIHNIKPISCRRFDRKDCHRRLEDRGLHGNQ